MECTEIRYTNEGHLRTPWGKVWYGVAGSGSKPALVTLHGGPGAPHYYFMHAMSELASDRPVVFYDQLGCGRSDRPSNPSLWTAERFAEELAVVVGGLAEAAVVDLTRFHLWGHSWGTALAVLYALTAPPALLTLTLASPILDIRSYRRDLAALLKRQPEQVQLALTNKPIDSAEYQAALEAFYHAHLYMTDPWDPCAVKAFTPPEFGVESYMTTVGPDELHYIGNFRDRDDSARLADIRVPTLLLVGRHDLATPERAAAYQRTLPRTTLVVFENSSHWYFEEERTMYVAAMRRFLASHDSPS